MIERKFLKSAFSIVQIEEYIRDLFKNVGISKINVARTPLGEKITIFTSKPGLVVGKKGENIKKITDLLKNKFNLENPVVEIAEIEKPLLDSRLVAEKICSSLEKWGIQRFKAIVHKMIDQVMASEAKGVEIIVSGKLPSARAKSWRFAAGNIIKAGAEAAKTKQSVASVNLPSGTVGVKVRVYL